MEKTTRQDKEKITLQKFNNYLSLLSESGQLEGSSISSAKELDFKSMSDSELEDFIKRIEKETSNQIFYMNLVKIIKFIFITPIVLGIVGLIILGIKQII